MYMTGIAALASTLVMTMTPAVAAADPPLSCVPSTVTRSAGFRLDLDTNTFSRPIIHPHAAETGPADINSSGQIVGAYREQSGQEHAFRLDGTTFGPDFDHPDAGTGPALGTLFTDIDAGGTILGNYDDKGNVC